MCAYFVLNKMGVVQDPTRFLLCFSKNRYFIGGDCM